MCLVYNNSMRLEVGKKKCRKVLLHFYTQVFLKLLKSLVCGFEVREPSHYVGKTTGLTIKVLFYSNFCLK